MLINSDCLDYLPTIPDASVDFVLCDLPYGTTAIAAINTGQNYIYIEQDPTYFETMKARVEATGELFSA